MLWATSGFLLILVPAGIGGAIWEAIGFPLGWMMGAALVAGAVSVSGRKTSVPKPLHSFFLATIGASVGLSLTPSVVREMVFWFPMMVVGAGVGIAVAAILSPVFARTAKLNRATAFFSLLPGGVIEMASVGKPYGADETILASVHAVRVGLVVFLLPTLLYLGTGEEAALGEARGLLGPVFTILAVLVGVLGGFVAGRLGMPAAWLLGSLIAVGSLAASGILDGSFPPALMALAQIVVGISLGSRFQRDKLSKVPRAMQVGTLLLLAMLALMAGFAGVAGLWMPFEFPSLVLAFAIGGMAEMVLAAKALDQAVALVAAFQAVRGIIVNLFAARVWRLLNRAD